MSDDEFVVDMDEVEVKGDFEAVPAGWYHCMIDKWTDDREIKKADGKLPIGTKGTNWEFTVVEGEHVNQKFWACYWHHRNTASFFKALYQASGVFTDEELSSTMNVLEERDRVIGSELWLRVDRKTTAAYGTSNNVKAVKHIDERQAEEYDSPLP